MTPGKDQATKTNQDQPVDAPEAAGHPGRSAAEPRRRADERLQTREKTPQSAIRNWLPSPQNLPDLTLSGYSSGSRVVRMCPRYEWDHGCTIAKTAWEGVMNARKLGLNGRRLCS